MTSNMKSRQAAYLKHRTNAWCRIDMLLALYDAGIKNVEAAMAAAKVNDQEQLQMHRQKADPHHPPTASRPRPIDG